MQTPVSHPPRPRIGLALHTQPEALRMLKPSSTNWEKINLSEKQKIWLDITMKITYAFVPFLRPLVLTADGSLKLAELLNPREGLVAKVKDWKNINRYTVRNISKVALTALSMILLNFKRYHRIAFIQIAACNIIDQAFILRAELNRKDLRYGNHPKIVEVVFSIAINVLTIAGHMTIGVLSWKFTATLLVLNLALESFSLKEKLDSPRSASNRLNCLPSTLGIALTGYLLAKQSMVPRLP